MSTIVTRAGKGSPLTNTECDSNLTNLNTDKLEDIVEDTTPQLGGDLDVNGNSIVSVANADINITPNGTGSVVIDGLSYPQSDGTNGQVLTTNGTGTLSFATASGGGISSGTTAQRPASPSIGDIRYNTDERQFEAYRNQIDSSVADDWYPLSPWELIEEGSFTGLNINNPFVIGSRYYPNESVTGRENFTYTSFRADIAYRTLSSNTAYPSPQFYFGYETPVNSTGGSATGFTTESVKYRREWNNGTSSTVYTNHIHSAAGNWTPVIYSHLPNLSSSGTVEWGTNFGNTVAGTCHFESIFAYSHDSSTNNWCKVVGAMEVGTFWYNQSPCLYLTSNTSSTGDIDVQYRLYGLRGIS